MKIFNTNNSKHLIRRYFIMAVTVLCWLACEEDREVDYSEADAIELENADPYLQVVTGFVPFEVGTKAYGVQFNAINGTKTLSTVKMYGTFYDAETGTYSNEALYGEYPIESSGRTVITDSLTYDELKEGLTVNGNTLPDADTAIFAGSGWSFRFEGDFASGETKSLTGEINMVLSKYAGIYTVSESTYMRIQFDLTTFPDEGVAHWDDNEVFIGFVDQNTLSYNDAWGYFSVPGCSWQFDYDEDGKISNIVLTDGYVCASSTATLATCEDSPSGFNNLSAYLGYNVCDESLVIIDNDETGEHVIKLTYGYLGAGGYRQFTETLTKKVE